MFETHITIQPTIAWSPDRLAALASQYAPEWHYSYIARDPVMGDKDFFYFNSHSEDLLKAIDIMLVMYYNLKTSGVKILRKKIECIIHDERYE